MTELRLTMKTSFLLPLQSLVFSLNASVSVVKAFSTQDAKLSMARPGLTKPTTQGKATEAFRPSTATFLAAKGGFDDSDDMVGREEGEGEGEYSGPVDWDEEWKKVVKNKDQPAERPGRDFYKSEAEIAAIQAANKAQKGVMKAASKIPPTASFNSLKGDWKVSGCIEM